MTEEIQNNQEPQSKLTKTLIPVPPKASLSKFLPFLIVIVVVAIGIFTGLIFASRAKSSTQKAALSDQDELPKEIQQSFAQTFKDQAEGVIEKNDQLDKYAQGTHKLIRPGGESQTAFLTSSVLDLNEYNGKKVKVSGETYGSSQVGWLMDVGKVEVIE